MLSNFQVYDIRRDALVRVYRFLLELALRAEVLDSQGEASAEDCEQGEIVIGAGEDDFTHRCFASPAGRN